MNTSKDPAKELGQTGDGFWLERMYTYLRLPFWAGVLATVSLVGVTTVGAYFAEGVLGDSFSALIFLTLPPTLASAILIQFAVRYMVRKTEQLRSYSRRFLEDNQKEAFHASFRFKYYLLAWAILGLIINPPFVATGFPVNYSFSQRILLTLPYQLVILFVATFLWTWLSSMYNIYRIGKLPMKLRPFTEDQTLGLRPFGMASLGFTVIYVGVLAFAILPLVVTGLLPELSAVIASGMFSLAPILFALPLLPLHSKLIAAKRELSDMIGPRYTRAFERFSVQSDRFDEGLSAELASIDTIRRDIHQMHTWPLDTGILVRLTAVVLSVIAILVAKGVSSVFPALK
ncbi:MAG: hypothetical protein HY296_02290 [Thaumarchaeota archaeon]|nr:hypothetical protein [Nitrososphaerota archaeon]